jgi:hypothetical protein
MSTLLSLESQLGWRNFGKQFLNTHDFIALCNAVGIYGCTEMELEEFERERLLFPVARVVMPDDYAHAFYQYMDNPASELVIPDDLLPFHELDWALRYKVQIPSRNIVDQDFRHPIDKNWERVDGLYKPIQEEYRPWENYSIEFTIGDRILHRSTVAHYYHYWQIYELYQVRKRQKGMYGDNCFLEQLGGPGHDDRQSPLYFFDAVSYFRHLYSSFSSLFFNAIEPNNDGQIVLNQTQQGELEQAAKQYASDTVEVYELDENSMYAGLRQMMELHADYEQADRIRLASSLRRDIWYSTELIHFSLGIPTEDIAAQAGSVANFIGNYLELLFPNRREQVRDKSLSILRSLVTEHNRHTTNYSISDNDIVDLFNYTEATELAWFEYILNELNDAFFSQHSWSTASILLHLQSLASFPESLMKTLILRNSDIATQADLQNQLNPGLSTVINLVYRNINPPILNHYQNANHWSARDSIQFTQNLSNLLAVLPAATHDEMFVGVNLAIATLIRNFTSHFVIENQDVLQGQYVLCLRAIITTILSSFFVARNKGWV